MKGQVAIRIEDPAADTRDALSTRSGVVEPLEKLTFAKLAATVIDANRCVQCGACAAACPSKSISLAEDELPTLTRMCTGCSFCWDFCPRAGLRTERLWKLTEDSAAKGIGLVKAAYSARAHPIAPNAQDGGVVTGMLTELLKQGYIQAVVTAKPTSTNPLKAEAFIAKTPQEVIDSAGSFYNQTFSLGYLADSNQQLSSLETFVFVGTPCQITALKAMQRMPWKYRRMNVSKVRLTIALMCTRAFHYGRLIRLLKSKGIQMHRIRRIKVKEKTLQLYDEKEVFFSDDVVNYRQASLRGCQECFDFVGRLADITVGSLGSPAGYSTILLRTIQGEEAWNLAKPILQYQPQTDLKPILDVERRNQAKALKALKRSVDSEAPLWIGYEEHLRNYMNTDRAPVKPATYRVHHYDITC